MLKTIKILGNVYDVEIVKTVDTQDAMGCVLYSDQLIKLKEDSKGHNVTLLLEVFHAISWMLGCDLSENQIAAMSEGLFAVMQDNSEFVKLYTTKGEK